MIKRLRFLQMKEQILNYFFYFVYMSTAQLYISRFKLIKRSSLSKSIVISWNNEQASLIFTSEVIVRLLQFRDDNSGTLLVLEKVHTITGIEISRRWDNNRPTTLWQTSDCAKCCFNSICKRYLDRTMEVIKRILFSKPKYAVLFY